MKVVGDSRPYTQALIEEVFNNPAYSKAHLAIEGLLRIPNASETYSNVPVGAHSVVYSVIYHVQNPGHGNHHIRKVITSRSGRVVNSSILPCILNSKQCICEFDPQRRYELPRIRGRNEVFNSPSLKFLNHASIHYLPDAEAADIPSVSLRSLLQHRRNKFIESLHDHDTLIERIKLAYQLAVSTCVLMDSEWSSQLCSCTVTVVPFPAHRHYHAAVGPDVHHFDSATGRNDVDEEPWCQKLGHMPIRRLGFLLAEIGIGATIHDAFIEEDIVEVSFNDFVDGGRSSSYLFLGAIQQKIKLEAGSLYGDIVGWCLGPREARGNNAISQFYNEVLQPLREQYLAVVERRGVQERIQKRLELLHA